MKFKEWIDTKQEFTSKDTSINKGKVPALFSNSSINWKSGTRNLDIGGGKFDTATNYLKQAGVENFIYDKFNRSTEHNQNVLKVKEFDTATLSNVLNVIKEQDVQETLVKLAASKAPVLYVTVYKDTKATGPKVSGDKFQHHMKLRKYIPLIKKYFNNAVIRKGVIHAWK